MNIWGCKNKIRKIRKDLKELGERIKNLQDRTFFARKDRRKSVIFEEITYTLDEADDIVAGLNKKYDAIKSRGKFWEKKLIKERQKKVKKK